MNRRSTDCGAEAPIIYAIASASKLNLAIMINSCLINLLFDKISPDFSKIDV